MDIATAKILVSAILLFAVILFSYATFEQGIKHIVRDLKDGRKPRVRTAESRRGE